jgi:hypothetical protein
LVERLSRDESRLNSSRFGSRNGLLYSSSCLCSPPGHCPLLQGSALVLLRFHISGRILASRLKSTVWVQTSPPSVGVAISLPSPPAIFPPAPVLTMKLNAVVAALGLAGPAHALLRFGCARLTVQRLDPLVTPGQNPSPHLHQIIGGVGVSRVCCCEHLLTNRTRSTCR